MIGAMGAVLVSSDFSGYIFSNNMAALMFH